MTLTAPIRVNRAPVLTLWAAVVAERLGHPEETALSVASAVAGVAAQAKPVRADGGGRTVTLLGRAIPVMETQDGVLLAADPGGVPAEVEPVRRYLARAFGSRLAEARAAMEALAARLPPEELNRVGFQIYEAFRPEPPVAATGGNAKGALRLERIRAAAQGAGGRS